MSTVVRKVHFKFENRSKRLKSGPAPEHAVDGVVRRSRRKQAKPEGHTLRGVETQSAKYLTGLPKGLPRWGPSEKALPFAYESTGTITQFTNNLDPDPRSREVFAFHRPEELVRLVNLESQLRSNVRTLPELDTSKLWEKQVTAITKLEQSLAAGHSRSLIQMVMGAGKTFTACNIAYRLIKFAHAKRVLFLVDRNNLGKQTLNEFQQFASPYNQYKFTEEFGVQHLKKNTIDPAAKVVITTIQRLYSILKGEAEFDESGEEASMFEGAAEKLVKEPLPVVYNDKIPPEFFDFIIVDECHRSIYNVWRQVLEYFDASLIGLTATPSAQTIGFFNGNLVMEYTHEEAVLDGVNVGYDVYRIETKVTKDGATLAQKPDYLVPRRDRSTRKKRYAALDADIEYSGTQLDRDVVNESQIRLVIRTFRDRLPEIFPGRKECPKTLVFAKTDLHADDVTRIIREEFGKGNDFCHKITSKSTGKKPEELLNEFRNSFMPRVAVTVDMIATGTDVKPLECLLFMRNIASAAYFEQMKGRGCRIITPDMLQAVTPDAPGGVKTHFVIVDAVGVTESEKSLSKPLDRQPSDYVVVTHLVTKNSPWTVEVRLVRTIDGTCLEQWSQSFDPDACRNEFGELVSRLHASLQRHAGVRSTPSISAYAPPDEPSFSAYLLRLEQLLAVRCGSMEGVSTEFPVGMREVVAGNLHLCLECPRSVTTRVLLMQTIIAMNRVKPEVVREFRDKLTAIQSEQPLSEPAQHVVQAEFDKVRGT